MASRRAVRGFRASLLIPRTRCEVDARLPREDCQVPAIAVPANCCRHCFGLKRTPDQHGSGRIVMRGELHEIQAGWEVYEPGGERVGDVVGVESGTVHVQTGGFFAKDLYIPP